ncbi:hypothetical protein PsYK624_157940 [Phanerochaete sordida]|uniref:Uncharacterized protein n=1 Tax=Phanerochaete sordida TaxID=48140 RepID=A0A9P3GPK3_9APHY|nr:hypothetical protein PsYK624_157940 [Phanerochaete sordida]
MAFTPLAAKTSEGAATVPQPRALRSPRTRTCCDSPAQVEDDEQIIPAESRQRKQTKVHSTSSWCGGRCHMEPNNVKQYEYRTP